MSAYELATKLRAGGFCPASLKLVAVTGYANDREALAAAGFDGHLSKPVDVERLGETLANVIAAGREPHAGDTSCTPANRLEASVDLDVLRSFSPTHHTPHHPAHRPR
jgi:DNA-binding NarL/FixJ family response regulator